MSVRIIPKAQQARGAFNGGQIIENKPIGFPQDGGFVRPFSTLFYWARAQGMIDSTIGQHPHQGFEIMSFVLEGQIRHFDTKNNKWIPLKEGDVQIIRAGNGIEHAEHLEKDAVIFQIWFDPDLGQSLSKPATYDDYESGDFKPSEVDSGNIIHYSGEGGKVKLDTDADIRRLKLAGSYSQKIPAGRVLALYVITGSGQVNDQSVAKDDFVILEGEGQLNVAPDETIDLFYIEVAEDPGYRTYAERAMLFRKA